MEDTDRRAEGAVGMTTTMVQPAEAASTGKQENAATAAVQGGGEETVLCGDCGKRCAAHADGAAGGRIDEADGLFYCNVCWASYEEGGAHGSGVGCNGDSDEEDGDDDPEEGCMRAPPRRWMTFEDALLPSPPSEDEQQQLTTRRADSHALAVVLDPHTKRDLEASAPPLRSIPQVKAGEASQGVIVTMHDALFATAMPSGRPACGQCRHVHPTIGLRSKSVVDGLQAANGTQLWLTDAQPAWVKLLDDLFERKRPQPHPAAAIPNRTAGIDKMSEVPMVANGMRAPAAPPRRTRVSSLDKKPTSPGRARSVTPPLPTDLGGGGAGQESEKGPRDRLEDSLIWLTEDDPQKVVAKLSGRGVKDCALDLGDEAWVKEVKERLNLLQFIASFPEEAAHLGPEKVLQVGHVFQPRVSPAVVEEIMEQEQITEHRVSDGKGNERVTTTRTIQRKIQKVTVGGGMPHQRQTPFD